MFDLRDKRALVSGSTQGIGHATAVAFAEAGAAVVLLARDRTRLDIAAGPMGKLDVDMEFKFTNWEMREQRACAALDFAGTMKAAGEAKPGLMGMAMTINDGTTSGQSWFDPDLGMVVESAIRQKLTMLMTMPQGAPNAGGGGAQTLTNRIDQKINLKLVEFEPGAG